MRLRGVAVVGVLALLAGALALGAPAGAAAPLPSVTTGSARSVGYASALLTGTVNPQGSETSYYFQYGVTHAYGLQSAIADAGTGTHGVGVAIAVSGLQPLTLYHYRLVAVNHAGVAFGADHTLLTTRVPLSLAILAAPNPVIWGGTVVVQGTLSGTGNAGREVVLQANTFPFAGFLDEGNPELTSATGGFSFPVLGLLDNTQFRVVTTTSPPVISPVTVESVAVGVASHVRATARAHFARIYGTVVPAEDGAQVGILRIVHGRGVLVGGTRLRHRDATSSSFSSVVHIRARGIYRVLVVVSSGAQSSSYGQPLFIG